MQRLFGMILAMRFTGLIRARDASEDDGSRWHDLIDESLEDVDNLLDQDSDHVKEGITIQCKMPAFGWDQAHLDALVNRGEILETRCAEIRDKIIADRGPTDSMN